jgi:hypothetical protein
MEHNNATATDYGILISRDGQTVEQCLVRPDRNMDADKNNINQETTGFGISGSEMGEIKL